MLVSFRRHRRGEQVALDGVAAVFAQEGELVGPLDALGDGLYAVALTDEQHAFDQHAAQLAGKTFQQERAVELDDVHIELAELAQRGLAGTEIVHRHAEARSAQFFHKGGHASGFADEGRFREFHADHLGGGSWQRSRMARNSAAPPGV